MFYRVCSKLVVLSLTPAIRPESAGCRARSNSGALCWDLYNSRPTNGQRGGPRSKFIPKSALWDRLGGGGPWRFSPSPLCLSPLSLALSSLSVFDTEFFVHFPNTPPPSLFAIYATLYWVLGPPGLDSKGDGAASALQGATARELRPTVSPPGCNRIGGGDLGSGISGERGDF